MKRILANVAFALALLLALPASAALDGTMSGVVKDKSGAALPGVSVEVRGPTLQGPRIAVTKSDGSFLLKALPPGAAYKLSFSLSGFKSVVRTGLAVNVTSDTQVSVVLELADVSSEVVVTGEAPIVDVTQTNTAQNFTTDYLRKVTIGTAGRSYQGILSQAAGVAGGGNPNVLGGSSLDNTFLIDGVNSTDPVTHTFSFNLNFDTIAEVGLQTSGYAAEYGRANGGVVNVITKSGGNEFSGSLDVRYATNKFSNNGDFFDPSLSESRNSPWGVTLGGPILKDSLWFFGNLERPDNFTTPYTTNATVLADNSTFVPRAFKGWNSGVKLSFTLSPQFNGTASYNDALATIAGATNSVGYTPDATYTQQQRATIYNLKLNGLLGTNWIVEAQGAKSLSHLEAGPVGTGSSWYNRLTGVYHDNYTNYQASDRNRNQIGAAATYFLSDFVGNHSIKFGVDGDTTSFPSVNYTTGFPSDPSFCPAGMSCGAYYTYTGYNAAGARVPYQQLVSSISPLIERTGKTYAAYVQDQWRPNERLTFNIGLRSDWTHLYNNQQIEVINFNALQPRLSAAYDILGDGKNVFRANYGQFYQEPGLMIITSADSGIISPVSKTYQWNGTAWAFLRQTGGNPVAASLIDPALKPTYDDQVNFAFERQVMKGGALTATYFYKKTHNNIEDTCTPSVACDDFWLTNNPASDLGVVDALQKNYYAWMLAFEYRFARGMVNASYTYSKSQGSTSSDDNQWLSGNFDHYPENFNNTYGYLGDDARNRFKIYGNYQIPVIETNLGVNYTYRSGFPYNVTGTDPNGWGTIYVEPRGTSRGPVLHQLDLQLEKRFFVGWQNLSLSLIGSAFNVLSSEQATGIQGSTTASNFRQATTWQRPRNYQIGFRADF